MHISKLLHFYCFVIQSFRFLSSKLVTGAIHKIALLFSSSSCRVSLLYCSFGSFSGNRVHWISCNLGLMCNKATWHILVRLRWITLLYLISRNSFLPTKIKSSNCLVMSTNLVQVYSLFTNCLTTTCIGSFIRLLLAIIKNHGGTLWWDTIELLLLRYEVHLRLRLHLITTTCKHLLLLLSELTRLHLLHIWLLCKLERRVLTHLDERKSLIDFAITCDLAILCKNILLHHCLGILMHNTIWLRCSSVLIFSLASRLLMVDRHLDLILLSLLGWRTCSVIKFSPILEQNVRNALEFKTYLFSNFCPWRYSFDPSSTRLFWSSTLCKYSTLDWDSPFSVIRILFNFASYSAKWGCSSILLISWYLSSL